MNESITEIKVGLATLIQQNSDTNRRLELIEDKLEAKMTTKELHDAVEKRVQSLEDNIKWLVRTIIAAIVLAGLAAIGVGKKIGVL